MQFKPSVIALLSCFCLCMISIPNHAQDLGSVSAYLCESYKGFQFSDKYLPVKYLVTKWPRDISSKEAWRLDSLYRYSDTIFYDEYQLKEIMAQDIITQKESEEIIASLLSHAKQAKTSSMPCAPASPPGRTSKEVISFSQPAFTKDKTKCLVTYDIHNPNDKSPKPLRSRAMFVYKWEGGKWVDAGFLEMNISEIGN